MSDQLNMLGIPADQAPVPNAAHLSPAQKEIIRRARRPEGITASEAGRIVHAARNGGRGCRPLITAPDGHVYRQGVPASARGDRFTGEHTDACCPWMSSDGWDVLKRLRRRGLVHQPEQRGPYFARGATA